jgi:hypothetical protein
VRQELRAALEAKFDILFAKLGVCGTARVVRERVPADALRTP